MPGKRLMVYGIAVLLIGGSILGCQRPSNSEQPVKKSPLLPLKWLIAVISMVRPAVPDTAAKLTAQAAQFQTQGRMALAEKHYRLALNILESAWGGEHPKVAPGLDTLATYYITQGDYAKAEPMLQRTLAIRDKDQTAPHPDLAATLAKYADLLRKLGRVQEALPLEQRAQALQHK